METTVHNKEDISADFYRGQGSRGTRRLSVQIWPPQPKESTSCEL